MRPQAVAIVSESGHRATVQRDGGTQPDIGVRPGSHLAIRIGEPCSEDYRVVPARVLA